MAYYEGLVKRRFGVGRSEGDVSKLTAQEAEAYGDLSRLFKKKSSELPPNPRAAAVAESSPSGAARAEPEKPIAEMTPAERQAFHDQKATAETSEKFRRGDHFEDGGDDILPGSVTESEVGELSRNYTNEQLRQLDETSRKLTPMEIRVKADAYRSGRLGTRAANDTPTVGLPAESAPTVGLSPDDTPTVGLPARDTPSSLPLRDDGFDPGGVTRDMPRPSDPFLPEGNKSLGLDPDELPVSLKADDGFDAGATTREMTRPVDPFLPEGNKSLGLDPTEPLPSGSSVAGGAKTGKADPVDPFLPDGNRSLGLDPDELPVSPKLDEVDTPTVILPETNNSTVLMPKDAKPLPIPSVAKPPAPKGAAAGGGFGMSPGGGKPPRTPKSNPQPIPLNHASNIPNLN